MIRAARRHASAVSRYLELAKDIPSSLHGFCAKCLEEFETRWLCKFGTDMQVTKEALEAEGVPEIYQRFLVRSA